MKDSHVYAIETVACTGSCLFTEVKPCLTPHWFYKMNEI